MNEEKMLEAMENEITHAGTGQIGLQRRIIAVCTGLKYNISEDDLKIFLLKSGCTEKRAKEIIEIAKTILKHETKTNGETN